MFQFPSNGKADPKRMVVIILKCLAGLFQFPSNGKADPKLAHTGSVPVAFRVSIPFKRESISKDNTANRVWHKVWLCVSIPFKRESISKVVITGNALGQDPGEFQFPSNGKAYPKGLIRQYQDAKFAEFQFPSNGKAYPKGGCPNAEKTQTQKFQFPSNGKAYPKLICRQYLTPLPSSFNSLQTGKHIQRHI